jgi:hypothetical protein
MVIRRRKCPRRPGGLREMTFADVHSVLAEGVGFEPTDPG